MYVEPPKIVLRVHFCVVASVSVCYTRVSEKRRAFSYGLSIAYFLHGDEMALNSLRLLIGAMQRASRPAVMGLPRRSARVKDQGTKKEKTLFASRVALFSFLRVLLN